MVLHALRAGFVGLVYMHALDGAAESGGVDWRGVLSVCVRGRACVLRGVGRLPADGVVEDEDLGRSCSVEGVVISF